jgi:hypothetical protein
MRGVHACALNSNEWRKIAMKKLALSAPSSSISAVNPVRSVFVLLLTACLWFAGAQISGVLPRNFTGIALNAMLGVLLTVWQASLIEWAMHRYVYHRHFIPFLASIYRVHHSGHHHIFFPPDRYVANGPVNRFALDAHGTLHVHSSKWRNLATSLTHFSLYMLLGGILIWLPAWQATHNAAFLGGTIAASALISYLFIAVHDAIHHRDLHPFIAALRWFRLLDDHHFIHHVDTEANVNFLLPLGDLLFGTLRLALTSDELARHGSADANRRIAIGLDEPAKTALSRKAAQE